MKKFLLYLLCILAVSTASASAAEIANPYTTGDLKSQNFTGSDTSKSGTINNVTWNLAIDWENTNHTFDTDSSKGIHIGSNSNGTNSIVLSTSDIPGTITSININASKGSKGSPTLSVKVEETDFKHNNNTSVSLTSTDSPYKFIGSASGKIEISYSSGKAVYLKSIEITYTTSSEGGVTSRLSKTLATSQSPT